ncbi:MAG: activator of HSP90 ATPase [Candidatus Paceibacteria bacterium]|jgi:activator of HSP90 ATPase
MNTKEINQKITFENTDPHSVYELLMDSKKHSDFTGEPADISREVDGKCNAYGDWIEAINVELIPDQKIVQKWRGGDWSDDHYSVATFEFESLGNDTVLTFTQAEVPEENHDDISQGWHDHYWDKMKSAIKG